MIALKSDLDLKDFYIINNTFRFLHSNEDIDAAELFSEYSIDIDYAFKTEDDLSFQVYSKLSVNGEHLLSGYQLEAEGVGFFEFDQNVSLNDKIKFLNFSALPICINNLRSFLSILTAHAPLGKYLLPAIDVNHLIAEKAARMDETAAGNPAKAKKKSKGLNS